MIINVVINHLEMFFSLYDPEPRLITYTVNRMKRRL